MAGFLFIYFVNVYYTASSCPLMSFEKPAAVVTMVLWVKEDVAGGVQ